MISPYSYMPLKTAALAFFSLLFYQLGLAQYTINGSVVDDSTGEAIIHCAVKLAGTNQGVLTDTMGKFSMTTTGDIVELEIRQLGYDTKKLFVNSSTNAQVLIRLKPSQYRLPTVEISDAKVELVHKDKTLYMYDYEFMDDHLVLVVHDKAERRSKLVAIDDNDSIIAGTFAQSAPGRLERDCQGTLYAISQEHAMKVEFQNGVLTTVAYPIEDYNRYVKPCIGYLDQTVYLEKWHNNQFKEFFYQPNGKGPASSLHIVLNKERVMQMAEEGFPIDELTKPGDILRNPASDSPAVMFELFFLQKTFFAPVYSPLFVLDGHVLVFDHVNGEILKYAFPNLPPQSTPVSYHKEKRWQKEIYADPERGEAYTVFLRNGLTTLKEIDLVSGKLLNEWTVPKQFISKIMIRNGVAYFMYKDKIYDDVNRLYRMRLK